MFGIKRGFTAIEAVIIVAILAMLGGIVWYTLGNKAGADVIVGGKGKAVASGTTFSPNPIIVPSSGVTNLTVNTNVSGAIGTVCVFYVPTNVEQNIKNIFSQGCEGVKKNNPQIIVTPMGYSNGKPNFPKNTYNIYIRVQDSSKKLSYFKADGILTVN
ncbi:MAG: hypothetical protein UR93_C0028G0001 [Berkelbacteria bacterium GW2011_GWA2_35_9]|uniref:Prepilin-type N-terminal cleavage/methylation domain-containing protein n=1 Tax=Berkelbacteria bacterium GW2011_GWA2_35_9 TaxID=1618333 RepID=A0A0G0D0R7_9BACT|nr:MAG: hypothetical protein UR93_C0028G0001 [Berkelbacteria bacterium GW2011_GWA2_35_9]